MIVCNIYLKSYLHQCLDRTSMLLSSDDLVVTEQVVTIPSSKSHSIEVFFTSDHQQLPENDCGKEEQSLLNQYVPTSAKHSGMLL